MTKKKPKTKKSAPKKPKASARNRGGRKSAFKPEYVPIVQRLCEGGAIDTEVATILGIHRTTLWRWCVEHPELGEVMQVSKEPANRRAFLAHMRKVCGYEYEEELVHYDSQRGKFVRTKVTKHVPPETSAFVWFSKNRMGWRDRHEHTGKDGGPIEYSNIERARRLAFILTKATAEQAAQEPGEPA